jgi:hypothetical protein
MTGCRELVDVDISMMSYPLSVLGRRVHPNTFKAELFPNRNIPGDHPFVTSVAAINTQSLCAIRAALMASPTSFPGAREREKHVLPFVAAHASDQQTSARHRVGEIEYARAWRLCCSTTGHAVASIQIRSKLNHFKTVTALTSPLR